MRQSFARLLLALALGCGGQGGPRPQTATAGLYARQDSDATTVWAPRLHVGAKATDALALDVTYAIDAWTGASIDVVTSATKRPVQEVRSEINAAGSYVFDNATVSGGYRYSGENDYWSNGGVGNVAFDLASNNTTLSLTVFGSKDIVGRSGDPGFRRPQTSGGGRITLTQVLDTKTVAQVALESVHLSGFLASPYRFVGLGGNGICGAIPGEPVAGAELCLPESHPHARTRNAATVGVRRALGEHASIGATYRFYFDDWGIRSHTLAPDLAFPLGDHDTLRLLARYYRQGQADFYSTRYLSVSADHPYFTRDRKMSSMGTVHGGLEYAHEFELGADKNTLLDATVRVGYTRLHYDAFLGLINVNAYEGTFLLSLDFR